MPRRCSTPSIDDAVWRHVRGRPADAGRVRHHARRPHRRTAGCRGCMRLAAAYRGLAGRHGRRHLELPRGLARATPDSRSARPTYRRRSGAPSSTRTQAGAAAVRVRPARRRAGAAQDRRAQSPIATRDRRARRPVRRRAAALPTARRRHRPRHRAVLDHRSKSGRTCAPDLPAASPPLTSGTARCSTPSRRSARGRRRAQLRFEPRQRLRDVVSQHPRDRDVANRPAAQRVLVELHHAERAALRIQRDEQHAGVAERGQRPAFGRVAGRVVEVGLEERTGLEGLRGGRIVAQPDRCRDRPSAVLARSSRSAGSPRVGSTSSTRTDSPMRSTPRLLEAAPSAASRSCGSAEPASAELSRCSATLRGASASGDSAPSSCARRVAAGGDHVGRDLGQLAQRHRDRPALRVIDVELGQRGQVVEGLDAFADHQRAEPVRQADHAPR